MEASMSDTWRWTHALVGLSVNVVSNDDESSWAANAGDGVMNDRHQNDVSAIPVFNRGWRGQDRDKAAMAIHIPNILLAIPRNPITAVGLPLALGFFSGSHSSQVANSNWYAVSSLPLRSVFFVFLTLTTSALATRRASR